MGKLTTMRFKTKRRTKNIDQVFTDLSSTESINKYKNQPLNEDLPGMGQHYCVECAKYFQNDTALLGHRRSKIHKRRLKLIKEGPYTQMEADAAAGNDLEKYLKKNSENAGVLQNGIAPYIDLPKNKDHIKKKKMSINTIGSQKDVDVGVQEAELVSDNKDQAAQENEIQMTE